MTSFYPGAGDSESRSWQAGAVADASSPYDRIAGIYDPWSVSVTEDVPFYLEEARAVAPGPVVELGIGTGRIAVPIAADGIRVIGVDSSRGMLEVCRKRAALAGAGPNLDLRVGDLRNPPVAGPVALVLCPFRSFLHMRTGAERTEALQAAYRLLHPGGRLVFDVFEPSTDDISATHGRWLEREPGSWELAEWDLDARTLTLSVRGETAETTMALSWISPREWQALLERVGFAVEACYGWFDRRPYNGGEDTVWIARRPSEHPDKLPR